MNNTKNWTKDNINTLNELWVKDMSARQIGLIVGKTRNAVIGKANRLGLPRKKNSDYNVETVAHNGWLKGNSKKVTLPEIDKISQGKRKYKLIELKQDQCRWGIGDPKNSNFHFCGAKIKGREPYCEYHKEKSVRSNLQSTYGFAN